MPTKRVPVADLNLSAESLEDRALLAGVYSFDLSTFLATETGSANTVNVVSISRDDTSEAEDVTVSLTGTSATAGTDFTAGPITVYFGIGDSFKSVPIQILGELIIEGNENIDLSMTGFTSTGTTAGAANPTATLEIIDDDAAIVSVYSSYNAEEPWTDGQFNLYMDNPSSTDTVVSYTVSGSATAGDDYTALSGTVTIVAGTTSATIGVSVIDDSLVEDTEAVVVTLTSITSGNVGISLDGTPAEVTIGDDDVAGAAVSLNYDAAEPGSDGQFTVYLTNPSSTDTVLSYTVSGSAAAGDDYTALSGTVTILAGTTFATIDVNGIYDDSLVEGDETVVVTLSGVTSGDSDISADFAPATVTILDDDSAIVSVTTTTDAAEPGTNGQFNVALNNPSSTDTVVSYTVSGSATAGDDYIALSGTVTILAGMTSATIDVSVIDELLVEANETVVVTLTSVTSGDPQISVSTTSASATVTINDDDSAIVSVTATTSAASEPGTNGQFTFSLNNLSSTDTVVNYTVSGTATAGSDYTALSGTVTIPAGSYSTTTTLSVSDDLIVEGNETVVVTLSAVAAGDPDIGVSVTPATVTISDDDQAVISINDVIAFENGTFTFTISSNLATQRPITGRIITQAVMDEALPDDVDYTDIETWQGVTFTIPGNSSTTTTTVTITVFDDNIVEDDEEFIVEISDAKFNGSTDAARATISDASALGTILNNDTAYLTINSISAAEEVEFLFTITSSNPTESPITGFVHKQLASAPPTGPEDFGSFGEDEFGNLAFTIDGDSMDTTFTFTLDVFDQDHLEDVEGHLLMNMTGLQWNGGVDNSRVGFSGNAYANVHVTPASITSINPAFGPADTEITIIGGGFNNVQSVKFGNITVPYTRISATEIRTKVPGTTESAFIFVTVKSLSGSYTAQSPSLFFVPPTIKSFTNMRITAGSIVTILGKNFTGTTDVQFGGFSALPGDITVHSANRITVKVPVGAVPGPISVTTPGGTTVSSQSLLILPKINSFTPGVAAAGSSVTITGTNFNGATKVLFGEVAATFTVDSDSQITATVPSNFANNRPVSKARITVETPSGVSTKSLTEFERILTPTISRVQTLSRVTVTGAPEGTTVQIVGSQFGLASGVSFGGIGALFQVINSTAINVIVPGGALTGPLQVVNPAGVARVIFQILPTITGFSNPLAAPGSTVVINGTSFNDVSSVRFDGASVSFNRLSDTQIEVTVPTGVYSSQVSVTTSGGSATRAFGYAQRTANVLGSGVLLVIGSSGNDTMRITNSAGTISISLNGRAIYAGSAASLPLIHVELLAGNDTLQVVGGVGTPPVTTFGGDGNDFMYSTSPAVDEFFGGAGNDFFPNLRSEDLFVQ